MSFTQENKTNIKVCNGCERRCALGIYEESLKEARRMARRVGNVPAYQLAYPTIAGQYIQSYYDEDGLWKTVMFDVGPLHQEDSAKRKQYEKEILQTARKIARLCDHYKAR